MGASLDGSNVSFEGSFRTHSLYYYSTAIHTVHCCETSTTATTATKTITHRSSRCLCVTGDARITQICRRCHIVNDGKACRTTLVRHAQHYSPQSMARCFRLFSVRNAAASQELVADTEQFRASFYQCSERDETRSSLSTTRRDCGWRYTGQP
jgi:hypothetical protein